MKRLVAFVAVLAAFGMAAFAQYMPTQKGAVLTYETKTFENNSTDTYTVTVTDVATDANGVVTANLVEKHKIPGTAFGEIEQSSSFIYNPTDGLTEFVMMTADEFKRTTMLSMKEMFAQMGQMPSEQDMAELEKALKPKGDITIPVPAKIEDGGTFANSAIRASLMGQSMGVKVLKGTYLGYEEVEVPAGKFNCAKLTFKFSIIGAGGEDTNITMWFAPEVGIVKNLTTNKKGKELALDTLQSIAKP